MQEYDLGSVELYRHAGKLLSQKLELVKKANKETRLNTILRCYAVAKAIFSDLFYLLDLCLGTPSVSAAAIDYFISRLFGRLVD